MDLPTLRRVLTAFADSPADLDVGRGTLTFQLRGDLIAARTTSRFGGVYVEENGAEEPAVAWLVNRVARLPMLADRLLEHLPDEPNFVTPAGDLLDELDRAPNDARVTVPDTTGGLLDFLGRRPAGTASVLYLTSDAGEGKTTLIHHAARLQARKYKEKTADWLIVPVALGGRTFLRFDDVIAGTLLNRLRFSFLNNDTFLELVRLGVIVPAFDGFEEMFVTGAAGDAISALGNLVQGMQSAGSVLVSARKAYFDYKDIWSQTRLFDSLGGQAVSFGCLGLRRWDRAKFIEYGTRRGVPDADKIHDDVAKRLTPDHPLLTRAVLVRRLLEVAAGADERNTLLAGIETDPNDFFRRFVGSIIAREVLKWNDRVGEVSKPLLTEEEHYGLLEAFALELWRGNAESMLADVLEMVAELFADERKKDPTVTRQVIERVKQHALIVKSDRNRFAFDHQEFYHYFLGEALGKVLASGARVDIAHDFRQGQLPAFAVTSAANRLRRTGAPLPAVVETVSAVCVNEPRASETKENLGGILIRGLDGAPAPGRPVVAVSFPPDSLKGRALTGVEFRDCYFLPTSLEGARLTNCRFVGTEFEQLELSDSRLSGTRLEGCTCRSVTPRGATDAVFAPDTVLQVLERGGFVFDTPAPAGPVVLPEPDREMHLVSRLLRAFMRSTGLNQHILDQRFGIQATHFFDAVLPRLEEAGVVEETVYSGGGKQRRFRLSMPLEQIERAVAGSQGRFATFLERVRP